MADERRAGSDLLQRVAGLVEVTRDREVSVLYSFFLRSLGMVWSYGAAASAIAVGSTGGAPDIETDHWAEGEFFRAQITKATFL